MKCFFSWCTRGEVVLDFCEAGSKRGRYTLQNCTEILSLRCHGHKVSFWSVAIESRGNSFQNDIRRKSSVTVRKQRTVLCSHCVQFPSFYLFAIITREHSKEHSLAIFGGPEGNRTPVRKPLDMTFSVGSQFLLFPTTHRQLTGNAQSVAPFCLIGSGATTDASSPLRSRSVRSRGPLRRNG